MTTAARVVALVVETEVLTLVVRRALVDVPARATIGRVQLVALVTRAPADFIT